MATFEYSRFYAFRSLYGFFQSRSYQLLPLKCLWWDFVSPQKFLFIYLFIFFSIEIKH